MKIKALKTLFDVTENKIYDVVSAYLGDIPNVTVMDDIGEVMVLFNDENFGMEFELIEE